MSKTTFWNKLGKLINENPVKFVGVVQAILAFAVVVAASFGIVIPSAIVAGFLGTLTTILTWWTQNNKTVPVEKYNALAEPEVPCEPDKLANDFAGFNPDGSSVGVDA